MRAMATRAALLATVLAQGALGGGTPEERIASALGGSEFLWGTATAAYQVEGAWNEGGKQQSIWDVFAHTRMTENGDVADDFYHRYESDIQNVKDLGFNAFRYSISWPRIYPLQENGTRAANPEGVAFYKNVTRSLLEKGITPIVTLYHWDLPDDLDWQNASVVPAFAEYAEFMFRTFPEVKHWATFNEPWTFCNHGYGEGIHAPGVISTTAKWVCGHNVLLAHAHAVAVYRTRYSDPYGTIGIVLNYDWTWPLNASNPADLKAVNCSIDFWLGWFADPVYLTGDYPPCMKERLGDLLPNFTVEEKHLLVGSYVGPYLMNTYAGRYTTWDDLEVEGHKPTFVSLNGTEIGEQAASPWLHVVPSAIRKQLEYVNERYKPSGIIVTENGCDVPGENDLPLKEAVNDSFRVNFYRSYLDEAAKAVTESKVPLKGYIAWSLEDNFEWADGYKFRFGITYVNYTSQARHPKASARWFTKVIDLATVTPSIQDVNHGARLPPAWFWVLVSALACPFVALCGAYSVYDDTEGGRFYKRQRKRGLAQGLSQSLEDAKSQRTATAQQVRQMMPVVGEAGLYYAVPGAASGRTQVVREAYAAPQFA